MRKTSCFLNNIPTGEGETDRGDACIVFGANKGSNLYKRESKWYTLALFAIDIDMST